MIHTIVAYSSGLTIAKYDAAFTCVEQLLRFLFKKFNVLDAFPVILDTCGDQAKCLPRDGKRQYSCMSISSCYGMVVQLIANCE